MSRDAFAVFNCRPNSSPGSCTAPGCDEPGHYACAFALRGKSSGHTCGRLVCEKHRVATAEGPCCPPHGRLSRR